MGVFDFKKSAGTLEDNALNACEIILSAGIAIRGGRICAGGNNVIADNAAKAFSEGDLAKLGASDDIIVNGAMHIIRLRQRQMNSDTSCYEAIAVHAIEMKENGWDTDIRPNVWDLNACGAQMMGYRNPEGVAKEFADAFGMQKPGEYKDRPVMREPQVGKGTACVSAQQSLAGKGLRHP
jgi:hypothetical protein